MTCSQPSGTTKGIVVAYGAADTGDRPLAASIPYYVSPNILLAQQSDLAALGDPANWDVAPFAGWNGQVAIGTAYNLLVRLRNSDPKQERASLNLQGWVSDYTAGGVGPGSAIRVNPTQPPGAGNPQVSFTGFRLGPLPTANQQNPGDPTRMLVLVSNEQWTPNTDQLTVNGGHVCVAVNVYADATDGGNGSATPADGGVLTGSFLDPACDRMYGQRNIQLVSKIAGTPFHLNAMVLVPVTDRCPLHALATIRRAELGKGKGGVLQHVPELAQAARAQGVERLSPPADDPLSHIRISLGRTSHRRQLKFDLEPGKRADLKVTLEAAAKQRPGDAYAFDVITTDTDTNRQFGAARVFVLVTDAP